MICRSVRGFAVQLCEQVLLHAQADPVNFPRFVQVEALLNAWISACPKVPRRLSLAWEYTVYPAFRKTLGHC